MVTNIILGIVVIVIYTMREYDKANFSKERKELVEMLVRKEAPESLPPRESREHTNPVVRQQKGR